MTPRRAKKKELAHWRAYRAGLPRLIDCSRVHEDYTYGEEDLAIADRHIDRLLAELSA